MSSLSPTERADLDATLQQLFARQTFGIKLGLGPTRELLAEFGNPQQKFPAVHVAGTNGKGSVCALIASVLQAAGFRVGLYSSPHLISFEERIRVDGVPIPLPELARHAREMMPVIERIGCTFFEGTTAIAFRHFAESGVDIAVVETGLGGRLDSTNVLTPVVSVITSIGMDHTRHLGDTPEKIATEKAGILKSKAPAVIGAMPRSVADVFTARAQSVGTTAIAATQLCRARYERCGFDTTVASFVLDSVELPHLEIGLAGRHQVRNAQTALAALVALPPSFRVDADSIRHGISQVRANTGIRGRFERLRMNPNVVVDVAHNPDGVQTLVDTLRTILAAEARVSFVFGAVEEKDVGAIARLIAPTALRLYAVRADWHRSQSVEAIATATTAAGIETHPCESVRAGIERALAEADATDTIVVCGSFYVVAEALMAFDAGLRTPPVVREERLVDGEPRLTIKEWTPGERPRERLLASGAHALSDAELLAILLRTGTPTHDAVEIARRLLQRFGGTLSQLATREVNELSELSGIGAVKGVTLAAAFEIAARIRMQPFGDRITITSPEDVASIFIPRLRSVQKEQFHVVILNSANQVMRMEMVSEGNLNSSIVHPREVFRRAIVERAASVIGLHNHPSGNPKPSHEDIAITKQLVEAGRILGITFHDHLIIAGEEFVSMAELGHI